MSDRHGNPRNMLRAMLLMSGIAFLLLGAVCSKSVYETIIPLPPTLTVYTDFRTHNIFVSKIILFAIAAIYSLAWVLSGTSSKIKALTRTASFENAALLAMTISFFAVAPELLLRPIALPATTIFMPDEDLDWKLRPGAEDFWGDAKVKINSKGHIGPEIDYAKPENTFRVLFLGDSVTFGFGIKNYSDTYVAQFESLFSRTTPDLKVETINAGVGGYSPWQYYTVLSKEGVKYNPDVVIVSFVLNDVTEKMGLTRFGGSGSGFQVLSSINSRLQAYLSKSAIFRFSRVMLGMMKYGKNMRTGAQQKEILDVRFMVKEPKDPKVVLAWKITLESLSRIYEKCKSEGIEVFLVVFPFTFQLAEPEELSGPQQIVTRHALEHGVPTLDLLPILAQKMADDDLSTDAYFIDADHPTPSGSGFIAENLVRFVSRETAASQVRDGDLAD